MPTIQQREQRARRLLAAKGMLVRKTPARSAQRELYGVGYMVVDAETTAVVSGAAPLPYWDSLEQIEDLAAAR